MLITIIGGLGWGKTLFMIIDSYFAFQQNVEIFTNFEVKFDRKKQKDFDLNWFLRAKYSNCIILLDEAYNYIESRISNSLLNRIMSYMLFQSRKKNVKLYITAQLKSSLDLRYNELSDILVVAQQRLSDSEEDFSYKIYANNKITEIIIPYSEAKKFFVMYKTNEIVENTDEKLKFDLKTGLEKEEQIIKQAIEIIDFYAKQSIKKISHNLVKLYFTTHELQQFSSRDTYTQIKLLQKEILDEIVEKKAKKSKKKSKREI